MMFRNIRRRIAGWLHPADITDLVRAKLGRTDFALTGFESLPQEAQEGFLASVEQVAANRDFMRLLDMLGNVQANHMAKEVRDMAELMFSRATLNGICLVRDEVERLSSIHRERTKRADAFDRSDLFTDLT